MRYIVYGAGAIGGIIAARLCEQGYDVIAIARGAHLDKIRRDGLTVRTPDDTVTIRVPAVASPRDISLQSDDVVLLAMKTQDTEAAVRELHACAGPDVALVCAQNGVENERIALRRFARVYGMLVFMPGTFLEPGLVLNHSTNAWGVLDLGRYPSGSDALAEQVAADLTGARFSSRVSEAIMRWKYAKLLGNLANAFVAACGTEARATEFMAEVREEALACYLAAGINWATDEEMAERRRASGMRYGPIEGAGRDGGSSWQSLARGLPSIETDYLNGEIVMLGRLHGVPTPCNRALQIVARRTVRDRMQPGSVAVDEIAALAQGLSA